MPTQLELEFHQAMIGIYQQANEAGYTAPYFLRMVIERGGVDAAKALINSSTPSDGYTALFELGHLDLTVEALVVGDPKWHPLFEPEEIERAKKRLKGFGY